MLPRRTFVLAVLPLLVSAGTALGVGTAQADEPHGAIHSVTPHAQDLDVRFRATNLPRGADLVGDSAVVRLNGEAVTAKARSLDSGSGETAAVRRVALVVDTSGSMAGAPLQAARAAAAAYLTAVAADVEVALITFAAAPRTAVTPTTDRNQVSRALPLLQAGGGTSLFDAVVQARQVLGDAGDRRVLVLSDGEDSASRTSLQGATTAVRDGGLVLDAVALGESTSALASLTKLTATGQGQLLRAGDDVEAVAAFREAARAFSNELLLRVDVPAAAPAGPGVLEVEVTTRDGQVLRSSSDVVLSAGPAGPSLLSHPALLVAGLLAVFGGLATALIVAVRTGDSQAVGRRRTEDVLASYTLSPTSGKPSVEVSRIGDGVLARGALVLAGRVLARGHRGERLASRLERAAVRFTAREWLVLQGTTTVLAFTIALLLSGAVLAVVGGLAAPGAAHLWLSVKASRRATAFEQELPDALQLVASGLSTGYSLPQALDSVVKEGRPPLAEELGRALAETRLGAPLESALDKVADRMGSTDFRWVVMAIRVQREVGGNLSEVLTTLCQTMRERGALRRQIKALSAEGRMGALILILMPIFVVAYLSLINPDFFRPMWETTLGNLLLGGSSIAMFVGALWMKKIVKVEA